MRNSNPGSPPQVNLSDTLLTKGVSDREVWSAIRYLDPESQRGVADMLAVMVLCWIVLLLCAGYLVFRL